MRSLMRELDFTPCRAELKIWIRTDVQTGIKATSRVGGRLTRGEEGIDQGELDQWGEM